MLGVVSRNRLGMLQQCLNSAITNAGNVNLTAMVIFDDDLESYLACPDYPWLEKLFLVPRHYYVRSVIALTQNILQRADVDYLVLVDDDTEFVQTPWAEACISYFNEHFPDGLGILDMLGDQECGQLFTTPAFVEHMGGRLHDPRYLQFYADTELRLRVGTHFTSCNTIAGRPFFVHKRDFAGGSAATLAHLKAQDLKLFKEQATQEGWSLYDIQ